MRKQGGRNRFWQNSAWKKYFCRFEMIEDQKKVILGFFSTRVWKNKSLIICVQEGGEAPPKFEIFCVITCGLTTHKISIAAPAEGLFIHYNKENYVEGRLEGWGDIFRDLVRSKR